MLDVAILTFKDIKQGPWVSTEARHLRRELQYQITTTDILGMFFGVTNGTRLLTALATQDGREITQFPIIRSLTY